MNREKVVALIGELTSLIRELAVEAEVDLPRETAKKRVKSRSRTLPRPEGENDALSQHLARKLAKKFNFTQVKR